MLPITLLVYLVALLPGFSFENRELVSFSIGAVLLILGIGLFNLGADIAMTPMGSQMGSGLSRQKTIVWLIAICFIMGLLITVAEPDLQVLANQVSSVMSGKLLVYTVGFGVGAFLVVAVLRIIFQSRLSSILMLFYMLLFALALMLAVSGNIALLPMAFDSGGVTTGPITVPFIMALGVGISGVLAKSKNNDSSFGLVSLCSIGPILAVLVLGIFATNQPEYEVNYAATEQNVLLAYLENAGHVAKEVALALGLIVAFFLFCQIFFLKLPLRQLQKIGIGVLFTYVGLVMFLTGVNIGYMPIGYQMGTQLSTLPKAVLVGIGLLMGVLVVLAEPAVHVLNKQVEDITDGYVRKRSMMMGMCIGVGVAIALSVIRIIFDFSLVYYIIPGYFISMALSLFVPPVYTAIAFDSGGVASGPLTSGFILPFAIGVCVALQGEGAVLRDGFGVVAMVAMAPLITIQLLGFKAIVTSKIKEMRAMKRILQADDEYIINFM